MFCPNCGSQIPDGSAFCTQCGKPISNAPQPQQETRSPLMGTMGNMGSSTGPVPPVPPTQPQPAPSYAGPRPGYMPVSLTPAQRGIKMTVSSSIFLVTVILYTVGVLFSLISGLVAASDAYRYTGMMVVMTLLMAVPGVLLSIGMWMAYGSSRQPDDRLSGVGLCRGVMIFYAVIVCIFMAAYLIITIYGLSEVSRASRAASYYYGGSWSDIYDAFGYGSAARSGVAVIIIVMIVVLAILVLALIYFLKLAKLCKETYETMMVGTSRISGTGYIFGITVTVIVLSVIGFFISIISGAAMADIMDEVSVVMPGLAASGVLSYISSLLSIAMFICAAITLSQFKNNMMQATAGRGYYNPPRTY